MLDVRAHNRSAWDRQVENGNRFTIPVGPDVIAAAREGVWEIYLTERRPVPRDWFPDLQGREVLCLAASGGQQAPILAAAGAQVTVLDNSPKQLAQDRLVAEREGLPLETVEGDMADLSMFASGRFDLIVHPISNVFVPAVRPVWREAYRVLRPGGVLMAGFMNPTPYIFDFNLLDRQGLLVVKHKLPYSDVESLSAEERQRYIEEGNPFEFSHSLEDQIGGQLEAGFMLTALFEDTTSPELNDPLGQIMPVYLATKAVKAAAPSRADFR